MGFSVYGGWVTSATILNVSIMLKSFGFNAADSGINEVNFGIAILITAECVYIAAGYMYSNPLYSSVYIWVLFAIKANSEAMSYTDVTTTTDVLLIVHGCYIIALSVWLALDKINNAPNEKWGFLY